MTPCLAVSVEGPTEREFIKNVLGPHLAEHGLMVRPVPISGCVSVATVQKDLRLLVADRSFSWVTTLYDLYGFQGRQGQSAAEMEDLLRGLVGGNPKLIPYLQTHEFEALVFAGPQEAAEVLRHEDLADKLVKILRQCGGPEDINDTPETCPSRRLKRLHPSYDKVAHGYRIIERIGLAKVRAACPRFSAWVDRLEALVSP